MAWPPYCGTRDSGNRGETKTETGDSAIKAPLKPWASDRRTSKFRQSGKAGEAPAEDCRDAHHRFPFPLVATLDFREAVQTQGLSARRRQRQGRLRLLATRRQRRPSQQLGRLVR